MYPLLKKMSNCLFHMETGQMTTFVLIMDFALELVIRIMILTMGGYTANMFNRNKSKKKIKISKKNIFQ